MYIPPVKNTPLFEKKGEGQIEAGISTNSVYAAASYAITNNYALAMNGSLSYHNFLNNYYDLFTHVDDRAPSSSFFTMDDWRGKFVHRYIEASFGKYNLLASQKTAKLLRVEIFAGGGYGYADDRVRDDVYKSRYYLGFIQGEAGLRHRNVEAGLSHRIAYSAFDYTQNNDQDALDYRQKNFNAIQFEPLLFARIGKGQLRMSLQAGINFAWALTSLSDIYYYRGFNDGKWHHTTFHLSVGLSYRF
jgi:hypothetical protein